MRNRSTGKLWRSQTSQWISSQFHYIEPNIKVNFHHKYSYLYKTRCKKTNLWFDWNRNQFWAFEKMNIFNPGAFSYVVNLSKSNLTNDESVQKFRPRSETKNIAAKKWERLWLFVCVMQNPTM